jgi:hypothetical protein
MNATMTETATGTAEESGNPAFDRLARIYELLGLDPDQADAATAADLACGWEFTDLPV